jgi:hypothetical protein
MIAALQAKDAIETAAADRDAANCPNFRHEASDDRVQLVEVAHERSVEAARGCLTLADLLERHRIAVEPDEAIPLAPGNEKRRLDLTDSRLVVMAAARLICKIAEFNLVPCHTAPGLTHRIKRISAALRHARSLIDCVIGFIGGRYAGAQNLWSTLLSEIFEIKDAQPEIKQDTLITLLPSTLGRGCSILGIPAAARAERIAVICRIDCTRIFMLLHSAIDAQAKIPPGTYVEWGGQFENLGFSRDRLLLVVPVCFAVIILLLYGALGSIRDAVIVFTGVSLALVRGVLARGLRGVPFLVSAAVGFIALSGIAVLNGLVMVSSIHDLTARGIDRVRAAHDGALAPFRPVAMTALVASLGFVPMALDHGAGAEVQKPLATVVIDGLISATRLTLFVLPTLYARFGDWRASEEMTSGDELDREKA